MVAGEFADVTVTRRLVNTPEEADRVGFRGSPTILLNGVDPFATESDPVGGLSCRVYQTPDGPAGSPTLDQLRREFIRRVRHNAGSGRGEQRRMPGMGA